MVSAWSTSAAGKSFRETVGTPSKAGRDSSWLLEEDMTAVVRSRGARVGGGGG